MTEEELNKSYIMGIIEGSRDNKDLLVNEIMSLCKKEYIKGLEQGHFDNSMENLKTIYYYNKNNLLLGIQEFEVIREKYLIETVSFNTELKYLETNYDINNDQYYPDSYRIEDIDVEAYDCFFFHTRRNKEKICLSYDREMLKKMYIDDVKIRCKNMRYIARLITQQAKEYENEQES